MAQSDLLYAYGFTSKKPVEVGGKPVKIEGKTPEEKLKSIKKLRAEYDKKGKGKEFEQALQEAADHDWHEVAKEQEMLTDYPSPLSRYIMVYENPNDNLEAVYFWLLGCLRDLGFPVIEKITDAFTASEHSSFYGAAGQRLGLAQDKVANYMASIGKMIKDMFQLVRELRWIDERLLYYRDSMGIELVKEGETLTEKQKEQRMEAAETALKGMWVDLVDGVVGGQKGGSNIFTMAQQLQFSTLPDLFFSIHPKDRTQVDKVVAEKAEGFNEMVINALKRKLYSYLTWKESTYNEMKNRRKFMIRYLNQHYQAIRMYITWIKPYLKHIEKLQGNMDRIDSPKLISSFEGSLVDIEILAKWMPKTNSKVYSVIVLTLEYRTRPQMQMGEPGGYHRGPIHVGETQIKWRSYAWTDDDIKRYKQMRERQDMELLTSIDDTLKSAMDALGDDLDQYLAEAGEVVDREIPEEKEKEKKPMDVMEPFSAMWEGTKEVVGTFIPKKMKEKKKEDLGPEIGEALKKVKFWMWLNYKLFKKSHGMITW